MQEPHLQAVSHYTDGMDTVLIDYLIMKSRMTSLGQWEDIPEECPAGGTHGIVPQTH